MITPLTPSLTAWERASRLVLGFEGGAVNDPDDRGGPTATGGVTESGLATAIAHGDLPPDTILANLRRSDALRLYRGVWDRQRCGDLAPAVGLAVFDASILQGEQRAARWLQQCLAGIGRTVALDGVIGYRTLAAAQATDPARLLTCYLLMRRAAIAALIDRDPRQKRFERGWNNRLDRLETECRALLPVPGSAA